MTNAILLRSGVNRKVHAPFWSRVGRSDLPGLGNNFCMAGDRSTSAHHQYWRAY
jgi:hypothetical protein